MVRSKINHNNTGYWFIAPFVIGFLVFGLYPVYNTIALSFTDTTLMKADSNFIAFKNFERLFADKTFITAIQNTWTLWLMNFIPQIGIALLLSVWFTSNRLKIKGGGIWRMMFYLPNLLNAGCNCSSCFSVCFLFMDPLTSSLLEVGNLPEAVDFIRSPSVMRGLVVFIQWWMWFGQTTILIMAGMTSISLSLYEAAVMDGANTWKMFRYITAPLIKPVLVYVLVTSLVGGMQMFDIPMLLTDGRGSPANSILTNNILMYMKFRSSQGHIGAASSVGVVVFIMTSFISLLIFYLLREKSDEKLAKGN